MPTFQDVKKLLDAMGPDAIKVVPPSKTSGKSGSSILVGSLLFAKSSPTGVVGHEALTFSGAPATVYLPLTEEGDALQYNKLRQQLGRKDGEETEGATDVQRYWEQQRKELRAVIAQIDAIVKQKVMEKPGDYFARPVEGGVFFKPAIEEPTEDHYSYGFSLKLDVRRDSAGSKGETVNVPLKNIDVDVDDAIMTGAQDFDTKTVEEGLKGLGSKDVCVPIIRRAYVYYDVQKSRDKQGAWDGVFKVQYVLHSLLRVYTAPASFNKRRRENGEPEENVHLRMRNEALKRCIGALGMANPDTKEDEPYVTA